MGEDGGDKSEEPTPHRMREAREKGQVAKSHEITVAAVLLITYYAMQYFGPFMWGNLAQSTQALFNLVPEARNFDLAFVSYTLTIAGRGFFFAIAPILGVAFMATFIAEVMQTGFVVSTEPLSPKLEKINPLSGFKKMFSMQGFVELIKSLLKIGIVFYIAWYAAKDDLPAIIMLIQAQPWDAIMLGGKIALTIALRVGYFYILIAILDYFYKRWEFMKNLRMSKQEIKEEYKRLEGDPLVKQRIRDLQRQAAYQRMMGSVPQADVVVTNPIHIAVALKYNSKDMRAPRVLAKGERKIAEEIVRIAEANEISVVQNEPLARSVFRTTKINQEVPRELYQAIAEVLAYIYKIKRDREERKKASIALSPR